MNPMSEYGETEGAVERMAARSNGQQTTMRELKELLLAVHHDSRARDKKVLDKIEEHVTAMYHVTKEEFDDIVETFCKKHEDRDRNIEKLEQDLGADVEKLEKELLTIRDNCVRLHLRSPRRATDPPTESWGPSYFGGGEDEEAGDMRRAWRLLKWVFIVVGGTILVAAGNCLSRALFGG